MSAPVTPLEGFQAMCDGLAKMIIAEEAMSCDPDGYFEPDFDEAATQAMAGFAALMQHPDFVADLIGLLVTGQDS